jgi:hypothetical protein
MFVKIKQNLQGFMKNLRLVAIGSYINITILVT